ncbi:MAG: hypothetical protein IKZ82_11340 [Clostridia bacterium]|nr:hypothetical protein [Clostridia bacterium]
MIAIILETVFLLLSILPSIAVATKQPTEMEALDVVIAAYMFAGSIDSVTNNSDEAVFVTDIVPLYDFEKKVVAYYLTFSSDCYAVVVNNKNNPAIIEFGEGVNRRIDELHNMDVDAKLIYCSPIEVFDEKYIATLSNKEIKGIQSIFERYPDIEQENQELSAEISARRKEMLKNGAFHHTKGSGDFGFFYPADLPTNDYYTASTIPRAITTDWVTTGAVWELAENHCGAVAATNLVLYFATRGKTNLKINNSKIDTFIAVHNIVGNGPTFAIAAKTSNYFSNRGYSLSYCGIDVSDFQNIKTATMHEHPFAMLLAETLLSWHWVIGVGWRDYYRISQRFIRINDGWSNNVNVYYKPETGSTVISSTEFWVDN